MKRHGILLIGLTLACIGLLSACSPAGESPSVPLEESPSSSSQSAGEEAYHKITADEAKKMMDEGGVTVVDVRRAEEYAQAHIPGALLVPNETIGDEPPQALPDKDAVLLVHCRTGVRSRQASDKLVELGYRQVYDFGGIADWKYETESGEAK